MTRVEQNGEMVSALGGYYSGGVCGVCYTRSGVSCKLRFEGISLTLSFYDIVSL